MVRKPWECLPLWGPVLSPLGRLYALAQLARRRHFARQPELRRRFPCPVISVGNLVVGGTGKTPFVARLLEILPAELRPAMVLGRGYGAKIEAAPGALDEEGLLLQAHHPEALVVQGADRVAAAEPFLDQVRSIILDDGAQHLRIERDLDIMLFDATELARPRFVLPAGPWREDLGAARAADLLVITRGDEASPRDLARASATLAGLFPETPLMIGRHRPLRLRRANGVVADPGALDGAEVVAVSGIARPGSFVRSLESLGARVVERLDFADHQAYGPGEARRIAAAVARRSGARLVTTEKDVRKIAAVLSAEPASGLEALEVGLDFDSGAAALDELLVAVVARASRPG